MGRRAREIFAQRFLREEKRSAATKLVEHAVEKFGPARTFLVLNASAEHLHRWDAMAA